jgi:anti-sigma B factor antagonist
VHLAGELDLCSAPRLQLALRQARRWLLVILDLRDLSFIDSSGVQVIVDASTRALAADRRLVITRGPAQVDRMLTLCGASGALRIVDLDPPTPPEPAVPPPSAA